MELVALLSSGKGTWGQVTGLINNAEWDNIILVGDDFAKKLTIDKAHDFVDFSDDTLMKMKQSLQERLKKLIKGTEVGLSIASGSGKEHMALISALLSVPVGIRFVALTKEGIVYL